MNKRLLMLVGIAGSGKSTWAHEYAKDKVRQGYRIAIVSRDTIRFSLVAENEKYFSKEKQVFEEYIENLQFALKDPEIDIIIADATHINQISREKILKRLELQNIIVEAIVFYTPLSKCLQQNSKRKGRTKVPEPAIYTMQKHFMTPTLEEGFDIITRAGVALCKNEEKEPEKITLSNFIR